MSVAVAHQVRSTGRAALREAAREAVFRNTSLAVIHVAESIDQDVTEAYRAGISDEIERALGTPDLGDLRWELHLAAGGGPDIAQAILGLAGKVGAELLVIGGLAPETQAELVWRALPERWPTETLDQELSAQARRHDSGL